MTQIIDDIHFACQAQYLVRLEGDFTGSTIGNELSYVTEIIDDIHFAWQAQYLVKLDGDSCCAAQYRVALA